MAYVPFTRIYFSLFVVNQIMVIVCFAYIYNKWHNDSNQVKYGEFFYHPLLMLIAFGVLAPMGSMTYFMLEKIFSVTNHATAKLIHAGFHTAAGGIALAGVLSMYKTHEGGDHWMSIHSWLGLWCLCAYLCQLTLGLVVYLLLNGPAFQGIKSSFMPIHKGMGRFLTCSVCWVIILGELSLKGRGDNTDPEELWWKSLCVFVFALAWSLALTLGSEVKVQTEGGYVQYK